jgi:spermidine/putrescine transport system permease protein
VLRSRSPDGDRHGGAAGLCPQCLEVGCAPWLANFDVRGRPASRPSRLICFFLLYLPIATLVVFAFNAGPSLAVWEGVSLKWFAAAWNNSAVQEAAMRSFIIAIFAATIATVAATMAALATTRTGPTGA